MTDEKQEIANCTAECQKCAHARQAHLELGEIPKYGCDETDLMITEHYENGTAPDDCTTYKYAYSATAGSLFG
jgi:hypothetical protein